MKEILQDHSLSELQILMEEWGERKFRARADLPRADAGQARFRTFRTFQNAARETLRTVRRRAREDPRNVRFVPTARKSICSNLRTGTLSKAC